MYDTADLPPSTEAEFAVWLRALFQADAWDTLKGNLDQNESELEDLINEYEDETDAEVQRPRARQHERGIELEDPAFCAWLQVRIAEQAEGLAETFIAMVSDGALTAWRAIEAPADWDPQAAHVGLHWSWTKEKADAIFAVGHRGWKTYLIEARLPVSSVNWSATLTANLSTEFGEDEDEVALIEDAPYTITQVLRSGKPMAMPGAESPAPGG